VNKSDKTCIVYWSPGFLGDDDWNLLYPEPVSLFDQSLPFKTETKEGTRNPNFFYCPSFKDLAKNTFVLKNPIAGGYEVVNNKVIPTTQRNVPAWIQHPPSMGGQTVVEYDMHYLFFSEDDIEMSLTSPWFENSPFMKYGTIVPGKLNISKWFRHINLEFNLHRNVIRFETQKDESLGYVTFNTDKQVKLVRFEMTDKLRSYSRSASNSSTWESWIPLADRYKRFMATQTNKLVLNEIKKNLVDTDTE